MVKLIKKYIHKNFEALAKLKKVQNFNFFNLSLRKYILK